MTTITPKEADLAGPGIGDYRELATLLPSDYRPLLTPRETMVALYEAKRFLEDPALRGAEPHPGAGAADRRPGERRQRLPRP